MKIPQRQKHTLDAQGKILGRFAAEIAHLLRGKHKTSFAPYRDDGDIVEVLNIRDLRFDVKKLRQKVYRRYSGYPGGLKEISLAELLKKNPAEVLKHAVAGMLPKNRLQKNFLKRLHIL